jgi:hypothetical protein
MYRKKRGYRRESPDRHSGIDIVCLESILDLCTLSFDRILPNRICNIEGPYRYHQSQQASYSFFLRGSVASQGDCDYSI